MSKARPLIATLTLTLGLIIATALTACGNGEPPAGTAGSDTGTQAPETQAPETPTPETRASETRLPETQTAEEPAVREPTATAQVKPGNEPTAEMPTDPLPTEQLATLAPDPVEIKPEPTPDGETSGSKPLSEGEAAHQFGWQLYREITKSGKPNIIISPVSIRAAMAMLYAGAAGQTAAEIEAVLRYTPGDNFHQRMGALNRALTQPAATATEFQLTIANSIWGQTGHPFLEDYLAILEHHYGAKLRPTDFRKNPAGSTGEINAWAKEQTQGKIPQAVPPGAITTDTKAALVNAVYFKAAWLEPFQEHDTQNQPFQNLDGSESETPMMHSVIEAPYMETDTFQATFLGCQGNAAGMIVILPKEGTLTEGEKSIDAGTVMRATELMTLHDVTLEMPRFEFETSLNLKTTLGDMGMTTPFTSEADFSGMDGNSCINHPAACLKVDHIIHKAVVKNDEEGTEAAAVTTITMRNESMREPLPQAELKLNRPFLFVITDHATQSPVFIGRVAQLNK